MSYAAGTHAVYPTVNPSVLVVQAGTALSSRTRNEQNAYNVLTLHTDHVLDIAVWMWDTSRFRQHRIGRYVRQNGKWIKDASSPNVQDT